jgi:hypothetical protein
MVKLSNNKQRGILRKLRKTIQCVNKVNNIAYNKLSHSCHPEERRISQKTIGWDPSQGKLGMKAFKTTFLSMKTKITYRY